MLDASDEQLAARSGKHIALISKIFFLSITCLVLIPDALTINSDDEYSRALIFPVEISSLFV